MSRAPVVLIHGLWSDSTAWKDLQYMLENKYNFPFVFAHSYPNAVPFNQNMFVPKVFALNALNLPRQQNIVAKKVDVIAHSMGGLLTKLYGNESYIRTITTVGTPHYGSPWADLLWEMVDNGDTDSLERWIADMFLKFKHPATDGAVSDLRKVGGTHCNADKLYVPINTIAGISALTVEGVVSLIDLLLNLNKFDGSVELAATLLKFNQLLFNGERNDWIVSETSQEGGFPGIDESVIWHCSEPIEIKVLNRIIAFLNLSNYSTFKNRMVKDKIQNGTNIRVVRNAIKDAVSGYVQISNPVSGQIFSPGDEVSVTITTSSPDNIVLVSSQTLASAIITHEPYNFKFKIPNNWVGPLIIMAGARSGEGFIGSSEIAINVVTSAKLMRIELFPKINPFFMYQGSSLPLNLFGSYDDGIDRDITFLPGETIFSSSNADIVEVSGSGMMAAKSAGQSLVTVSNSGMSKNILILVGLPPPIKYLFTLDY